MVKPERADVSVVAANSTPATCFANEHLLHTPTPATDSLRSAAGARVVPGRLASKLGDPVPDARSLDARWAIRSEWRVFAEPFRSVRLETVLSDPVSDSRGAEAQFVRDPTVREPGIDKTRQNVAFDPPTRGVVLGHERMFARISDATQWPS